MSIPAPEDFPALLPPRMNEEYSVDLLDSNDLLIRPLTEFTGGTFEQSRFADVHGGGVIDLLTRGEPDIDWGSDRIQIWYSTNGFRWPLGVFLVEAPTLTYDDDTNAVTCSVNVLDKLAVLLQDAVEDHFSLPQGTVVTDAVQSLIRATGETRLAVTDSALTLPAGQVWEAGTTRLQIVNDLLGVIGYDSIWVDGFGQYRVEPSRNSQIPVYTFERGTTSIHLPDWSKESDWFDVPNKSIMVTQSTAEKPGLVSVVRNVNGNDGMPQKYSIEARGRTISVTRTGVEAANQQVLDEMNVRSLRSSSYRVVNLQVEHALMPLRVGDLIAFQTPLYRATATISKYSIDLTPGSLASATWREVERHG